MRFLRTLWDLFAIVVISLLLRTLKPETLMMLYEEIHKAVESTNGS